MHYFAAPIFNVSNARLQLHHQDIQVPEQLIVAWPCKGYIAFITSWIYMNIHVLYFCISIVHLLEIPKSHRRLCYVPDYIVQLLMTFGWDWWIWISDKTIFFYFVPTFPVVGMNTELKVTIFYHITYQNIFSKNRMHVTF